MRTAAALDGVLRQCESGYLRKNIHISLVSSNCNNQQRRSLSASSLNKNPTEAVTSNNAVLDKHNGEEAGNVYSNVLSFYGASLVSSISEKLSNSSAISDKMTQQFDKYYKTVTSSASNAMNTAAKSAISSASKLSANLPSMGGGGSGIDPNKPPIVLRDKHQPQQDLLKSFTESSKKIVTTEERVVKLSQALERASSQLVKSNLVGELHKLLYEDPDASYVIHKSHRAVLVHLISLKKIAEAKNDKLLLGNVNQCLALCGFFDSSSIKHNHVNILSLDGGGAKGFVAIEILKNIERHCKKPIHEVFDYISGTSTGAVLAALLGIYKMPLNEIERQYKIFVKEIFQRNRAAGISSLIGSYGYYDTAVWESMLKEAMGDLMVINSARESSSSKISIVSNLTTPTQMKVFLFRNYNLPPSAQSQYDGTAKYKVWEAVRASSAAPGYYEDFKLDGYVFTDGGVLANNPTCIALHEAKQLWPSMGNNYTVVSIGNGRYKPSDFNVNKASSISLRQKINRIVAGVSDPETIHSMLVDLMPPKRYFRFSPFMSEEYKLDENRPIKWQLMQYETNLYMRRNEFKFETAAAELTKPKSRFKVVEDFLNHLL